MNHRDDDDIPLNLEDLPRVEPGTYEAVVLSTKKVFRFGLVTVEFRFRLMSPGPAFDVQLLGYCTLGPKDSARIRPHSKLAGWMRLIAAFNGSTPSRVTLRSLAAVLAARPSRHRDSQLPSAPVGSTRSL